MAAAGNLLLAVVTCADDTALLTTGHLGRRRAAQASTESAAY